MPLHLPPNVPLFDPFPTLLTLIASADPVGLLDDFRLSACRETSIVDSITAISKRPWLLSGPNTLEGVDGDECDLGVPGRELLPIRLLFRLFADESFDDDRRGRMVVKR